MARSKKTSKRFKRESLDWVVNDFTYGATSQIAVPNGGLAAVPLTVPQMQQNINTFGVAGPVGGYVFPEPNARQRVKAVVGHFYVVPTTWAVGSTFTWIARIMKKPMDFATGAAIADALYTLDASEYANERFMWQKVQRQTQTAGGYPETINVMAKSQQVLEPDEALFFIFENVSGITQTFNLWMYLRTLMVT